MSVESKKNKTMDSISQEIEIATQVLFPIGEIFFVNTIVNHLLVHNFLRFNWIALEVLEQMTGWRKFAYSATASTNSHMNVHVQGMQGQLYLGSKTIYISFLSKLYCWLLDFVGWKQ